MSKKSSQEKTQDICDAIAFGLNEGRKERTDCCCKSDDKWINEVMVGAQIKERDLELEISMLKEFVSNLFELNNGEYSLKDIDRALSHWEKAFETAKIQFT